MYFEIEIANLLRVESESAEQAQGCLDAVRTALVDVAPSVQQEEHQLFFTCSWEPPAKQLKKLSLDHPEVRLILWSEAFEKHHWIYKATFSRGKADEATLSRIDDEFPSVFDEIFGTAPDDWERKRVPAFQHKGLAH